MRNRALPFRIAALGTLVLSGTAAMAQGTSKEQAELATAETITSAEDLKSARAQSAATAKAKSSLATAIAKALGEHQGYSAVGAAAALKGGQAVAEITLMKGTEFKTVTEPLS
jgi:hypothetical protein